MVKPKLSIMASAVLTDYDHLTSLTPKGSCALFLCLLLNICYSLAPVLQLIQSELLVSPPLPVLGLQLPTPLASQWAEVVPCLSDVGSGWWHALADRTQVGLT